MLEVVEESVRWTSRKIRDIWELREQTKTLLQTRRPKLYSAELLEVLFQQPYCRIADLVAAGLVKRQAAASHLKQLVEVGVLAEEKVGREKLFIHQAYLKLLLHEDEEN